MTFQSNQHVEARIRASFERQSMMETISASLDEVSEGKCVISAPIQRQFMQQALVGHAGVTFTLGDTAAGYAALSLMEPGREVMTAEIKINLLAPAAGERLIATGEVVRAGRRLVVVRAEVEALHEGRRRTVAILQGTMMPVDPV